jgi:hypothetical protein
VSQFRSKYPRRVDHAIRQAVAANMRTRDILAGVRAGTLAGLNDEPIEIPDRTFHRKLAEAKAKIKHGAGDDPEQRRWARAAFLCAFALAKVDGSPQEIVDAIVESTALSLKEVTVGLAFHAGAENASSAREGCQHGKSKLAARAWAEAARHDPADAAEAVEVIREVRRQVRAKLARELPPEGASGWSHERSILDSLEDEFEGRGAAVTNGAGAVIPRKFRAAPRI